eukprot:5644719-Amphidinium_carterae.1
MPRRKYTPETPRGMRRLRYYCWSRKDTHTRSTPARLSRSLYSNSNADRPDTRKGVLGGVGIRINADCMQGGTRD